MTSTAYAVLGVSPESEDVVIRAAYRALMQKYTSLARPAEDTDADDRRAREVQAAYDAIEAARRTPEPPPRRSGAGALIAAAVVIGAGGAAALWALQPRPVVVAYAPRPALRVHVGPGPAAAPLARPMPCFVGGRSVGTLRLSDCAARNGVASGPLEIGAPLSPAPPPHPVVEAKVEAAAPIPAAAPSHPKPAAKPAPVHIEIKDDAALWRVAKAAAVRFAIASLAGHERKPPPAVQAPARRPAPAPADEGSLDAQMAQLQASPAADHLGELLGKLAPLVHAAQSDAAPPSHPAPPRNEPSVTIAAPARLEPAAATADEALASRAPSHPGAREAIAVVRDFYQALGEGDARLATTLVAPEQRETGSLSADRIRRFAASVRQPVRLTSIRALDDGAVAVRYQFVSSANQLCQGAADVATTERDDQVLIRAIKSTYAC